MSSVPPDNPPDPATTLKKSWLLFTQGIVPMLIAIVVLVIFWTLVKTMLGMTKVPEPEWNRALYLFGGVEAIAYAAAGFLFGREVHRQRAEQAEQRANSEERRATDAEKKVTEVTTKGAALKSIIKSKTAAAFVRANANNLAADGGPSDLEELSELVDEFFP